MEANPKYPRAVELVGGAVIENDEGKILITKSPKWHDKWVLPGGHIEPGETILEALVREGEEETGLLLEGITVYNWGEEIGPKSFHRPAHFIYFDAYCKVIGGELKLDTKELTEYKWLSPQEALKLDLAESYPDTIEKFIAYKSEMI